MIATGVSGDVEMNDPWAGQGAEGLRRGFR